LYFEGEKLNKWRDNIEAVVNSINSGKKRDLKSHLQILKAYFTRNTVQFPYIPSIFKYQVGERVNIDLSTAARKQFGFKYSLNPGKILKNPLILKCRSFN
jgi:hypothetical protein